ncbi:hypothetical protein [Aeromicrobium phragmitis]|uniref:hypothetical protein n=1 Tax=Aeromicrobium phragmitis TaxID=2478914 RepID=UPI00105DE622|nr:hypothetical protein [Aeromicrobium phragmitis]
MSKRSLHASRSERQQQTRRAATRGIAVAITVSLFAAILHYTYQLKVAPFFAYSGLTYREPNPFNYFIAILITALVALILPQHIERVSDFILWIVYVLAVAPSILLAQYSQTLPPDEATAMGLAIGATMAMAVILLRIGPKWHPNLARMDWGIDFWVLIGGFAFLIYGYMVLTTGLRLQLTALTDVYDLRESFGGRASGDRVVGYLVPVLRNVINPLLIARGIGARRFLPLAAGSLGQLVIYASTGHKSVLFSVPAIIGLAMLFRLYRNRPPGVAVLVAVATTSLLALVLDRITGSLLWTSLLSRRMMIVPGALTAAYVAVFGNRPRQNFADVIPFVDDPYTATSPVNIVGAEFVGNINTAANVNLFGHGYLNFGYLGMFIEGLVLVVLLIIANGATRGLPVMTSCAIFFVPSISFVSASVFTTALTHGFLAAVVVSLIAPSTGWLGNSPTRGMAKLNKRTALRRKVHRRGAGRVK